MDYKSKWDNSEPILNQRVNSDCICDTILDLQDPGLYPGYNLKYPISFNSNSNCHS